MKKLKNINRNNKSVAKAGLWFTLCNLLQRGIQFLVTPIYTRILMPEGYGRYSIFFTWCNLFAVVATLSLSSGVFNKAMAKYENTRDDYLTSMIGLTTMSTGIFMMIYFVFYSVTRNFIGLSLIESSLMFICIFFQMVIQLWSARRRYEYEYGKLTVVTIILSMLIPILGISLFYTLCPSEIGIILGYTISNIAVGGVLIIRCINGITKLINIKYWIYALSFNLPLIPHYFSNIVLGQSDRLMISHYCGDYYTGIYTLAYQISLVMNIVTNGIENALTPWTYDKIKSEEFKEIRTRFNRLTALSIIPFIIILLVAPEFVTLLGSAEYHSAIYVISPVVVSTYLMFINTLLVSALFYYEKNIYVMMSTSMGAIVNILLNVIMLPRMGYVAAAYTTVVGYAVIYCMNLIAVITKLKKVGKNFYDLRIIFTSIIVLIISAFIVNKLYFCKPFIRLVLVGFSIIFGIFSRQIITVLKGILDKIGGRQV